MENKVIFLFVNLRIVVVLILCVLSSCRSHCLKENDSKTVGELGGQVVDQKELVASDKIHGELTSLFEKYNEDFILSIISIPEIVNLEYVNMESVPIYQWDLISSFVSSMTISSKIALLNSLASKMESLKSDEYKQYIERIYFWCRAKVQFGIYSQFDFYSSEILVESLTSQTFFRSLLEENVVVSSQNVESLSSYQIDTIIYRSLNILSSLNENQQAVIFSKIYFDLSSLP